MPDRHVQKRKPSATRASFLVPNARDVVDMLENDSHPTGDAHKWYERVQEISCSLLHNIVTDLNELPAKGPFFPEWCLFIQTLKEEQAKRVVSLIKKGSKKVTSAELNCVLQEIVTLRKKPWFYPGWAFWVQNLKPDDRKGLINLIYEEIDKRYSLLEDGALDCDDILDTCTLQELVPGDVILNTIVAAPMKKKRAKARVVFDKENITP